MECNTRHGWEAAHRATGRVLIHLTLSLYQKVTLFVMMTVTNGMTACTVHCGNLWCVSCMPWALASACLLAAMHNAIVGPL